MIHIVGNVKHTPINHKIVYRCAFMKYSTRCSCRVCGPAIGSAHEIASPVNLTKSNGQGNFISMKQWLTNWRQHSQAAGDAAAIMEMGRSLLHIVAIYLFMDALYMSFVGVLKGAGDTRFVMWSIGGAGLCFMIGPLYVGVQLLQMGVIYAWMCVLTFITSLFLLSFYRFQQGKWKHMLVMEPAPHKDHSPS